MRLPAKEVGVHSPSRVQIPPSPRMTPALVEARGFSYFLGLKDKTRWFVATFGLTDKTGLKDKLCWFCGDFSGYWTLRVAGGVTFRRVGAGKSVF